MSAQPQGARPQDGETATVDMHPPLTTDVVVTGRLARRGQSLAPRVYRTVVSTLQGIGVVIGHAFRSRDTIEYPDEMVYLPPRYRGRIVLTRDPQRSSPCGSRVSTIRPR